MKNNRKKCQYCNGKGFKEIEIFYPVDKMVKLMKKHDLSQNKVSALIGVSQAVVSYWVKSKSRAQGIKKKYFDVLLAKGYK